MPTLAILAERYRDTDLAVEFWSAAVRSDPERWGASRGLEREIRDWPANQRLAAEALQAADVPQGRLDLDAFVTETIGLGDIDAFPFVERPERKAVNDGFGHEVGDSVLEDVAAVLRENVRGSDYYSNDEKDGTQC